MTQILKWSRVTGAYLTHGETVKQGKKHSVIQKYKYKYFVCMSVIFDPKFGSVMALKKKEASAVCQQYPGFFTTFLTAWIFDDTSFRLTSLVESIIEFFLTVGKMLADF